MHRNPVAALVASYLLAGAAKAAESGVSGTAAAKLLSNDKILELCFVVGALDLGVLGFLYSAYVTFVINDPNPPKIVTFLKEFCWAMALILLVLAGLAAYIAFIENYSIPTWIMVVSLLVVAVYSIRLVREIK